MQANLAARGGVEAADKRQIEINNMIWKRSGRQADSATVVGGLVLTGLYDELSGKAYAVVDGEVSAPGATWLDHGLIATDEQ